MEGLTVISCSGNYWKTSNPIAGVWVRQASGGAMDDAHMWRRLEAPGAAQIVRQHAPAGNAAAWSAAEVGQFHPRSTIASRVAKNVLLEMQNRATWLATDAIHRHPGSPLFGLKHDTGQHES
jgi:hypothetical protein